MAPPKITGNKNWRDLSGYTKKNDITILDALGLKGATQPTLQPQITVGDPTIMLSVSGTGSSAFGGTGAGGANTGNHGNTPPGTGTQGGTATAPANSSESAWIKALLATMGAPATTANVNSIATWIRHETPWPPVASNNPMNTTLSAPGATNFNSVGVKNYPTSAIGIRATIDTLTGGYPNIVAALKAGRGLCGGGFAGEFSKWSGGGYSSIC